MFDRSELTPDQLYHMFDITTLPLLPKRGRPSLLGEANLLESLVEGNGLTEGGGQWPY